MSAKRILIVDESPELYDLLRKTEDAEVVWAAGLGRALEMSSERKPDLAIVSSALTRLESRKILHMFLEEVNPERVILTTAPLNVPGLKSACEDGKSLPAVR